MSEANAEPVLEVKGLTVEFDGRPALRGVDLRAAPREITVLVGPSGSGKTTLLRAVNRLNECFPGCRTHGEVRLRLAEGWVDPYGGDVPLSRLRREAAMVFQIPNVLPVSIARNFSIPLEAGLGLSRAEARKRMRRRLGEVGLLGEVDERLDEGARKLSGGQQQRLCLARALALEPTLLLLDEPTANLDFRATRQIEDLLLRLKERYTIVAVSHSLGQTARIADHVLVLREGRIGERFDRSHLRDPVLFQRLVEEVF